MATRIRDRLVQRGEQAWQSTSLPWHACDDPRANELLNDLDGYPHAFVIGCLLQNGVKADVAWRAPVLLSDRLGTFVIEDLATCALADLQHHMRFPTALHRFYNRMAGHVHAGVRRICSQYGGDASRIWADRPASAVVIARFREFAGIGPNIASMAVNILARDLKVPLSDCSKIDVKVDVHVTRTMARLGLCPHGATEAQIIDKAREIHPTLPGIIDWPLWELGTEWCRPQNPHCDQCWLSDMCPSSSAQEHA